MSLFSEVIMRSVGVTLIQMMHQFLHGVSASFDLDRLKEELQGRRGWDLRITNSANDGDRYRWRRDELADAERGPADDGLSGKGEQLEIRHCEEVDR